MSYNIYKENYKKVHGHYPKEQDIDHLPIDKVMNCEILQRYGKGLMDQITKEIRNNLSYKELFYSCKTWGSFWKTMDEVAERVKNMEAKNEDNDL